MLVALHAGALLHDTCTVFTDLQEFSAQAISQGIISDLEGTRFANYRQIESYVTCDYNRSIMQSHTQEDV